MCLRSARSGRYAAKFRSTLPIVGSVGLALRTRCRITPCSHLAEEVRTQAEGMRDHDSRQRMLRIAEDYEGPGPASPILGRSQRALTSDKEAVKRARFLWSDPYFGF